MLKNVTEITVEYGKNEITVSKSDGFFKCLRISQNKQTVLIPISDLKHFKEVLDIISQENTII